MGKKLQILIAFHFARMMSQNAHPSLCYITSMIFSKCGNATFFNLFNVFNAFKRFLRSFVRQASYYNDLRLKLSSKVKLRKLRVIFFRKERKLYRIKKNESWPVNLSTMLSKGDYKQRDNVLLIIGSIIYKKRSFFLSFFFCVGLN